MVNNNAKIHKLNDMTQIWRSYVQQYLQLCVSVSWSMITPTHTHPPHPHAHPHMHTPTPTHAHTHTLGCPAHTNAIFLWIHKSKLLLFIWILSFWLQSDVIDKLVYAIDTPDIWHNRNTTKDYSILQFGRLLYSSQLKDFTYSLNFSITDSFKFFLLSYVS